jgi:hypothetical protein
MRHTLQLCYEDMSMIKRPGYNPDFTRLKVLWFISAAFLSACGQSDDGTAPAGDKSNKLFSAVVEVFPANYFDEGYSELYTLIGHDSNGKNYTGTFEVRTGSAEIFNGSNAAPVQTTLSYTTEVNEAQLPPVTIVLTQYFSTGQPLQYLGSVNDRSAVITTPQGQLYDIPSLIAREQSAQYGVYQGSDASLESISWSAREIDADTYELEYRSLSTDSFGKILSDETQIFGMGPDGSRVYWKFSAYVSSLDITFNFTSVP